MYFVRFLYEAHKNGTRGYVRLCGVTGQEAMCVCVGLEDNRLCSSVWGYRTGGYVRLCGVRGQQAMCVCVGLQDNRLCASVWGYRTTGYVRLCGVTGLLELTL
jgi:hypothetical protein